MKTLSNSITGESLELLRSIIGKKLVSYSHEPFDVRFEPSNDFFMRLGIACSNGAFILDNRVDWEDDWFCSPDYTPHMVFSKVKDESEFPSYGGFNIEGLEKYPVDEIVTDITLVQDEVLVYRSSLPYETVLSTEGVIFVTEKRQYGFYKENTWLNETVLELKGYDVLSKLEGVKKHWDVFAKPYDGHIKRRIVHLLSNEEEATEEATIIGDVYDD